MKRNNINDNYLIFWFLWNANDLPMVIRTGWLMQIRITRFWFAFRKRGFFWIRNKLWYKLVFWDYTLWCYKVCIIAEQRIFLELYNLGIHLFEILYVCYVFEIKLGEEVENRDLEPHNSQSIFNTMVLRSSYKLRTRKLPI